MITDLMESKPFMGMKIYAEIFNNGIEEKELLDDYIIEGGGVVVKKLNEKIDYVVFKEGSMKTIQFALEKGIKVVNPLWVNDKLNDCFKGIEAYLVKKSYNDVYMEMNYSKEITGGKNGGMKTKNKERESKGQTQSLNDGKKSLNSKKNNADNNHKITSFFTKA